MFNILKSIKNIFIHIRNSLKIIFLLTIATALIVGILSFVYKPMYSVTLNGEFIGYTSNKSKLQDEINAYMEKGEGDNVAFVDIKTLPEYSLCLLKKQNKTNEDEILNKVKSLGQVYYKYYAIVEGTTEKYYVATKEEAEDIINQLKTKKSSNIKDLAYTEVHNTEKKDFSNAETVVTALYKKQKTVVATYTTYSGDRIANKETASASVLGISLVTPTYGVITSRFGARSRDNHQGIDIGAPTGTTIAAAAGGTVVKASNDRKWLRKLYYNITWQWNSNSLCTL